MLSRVLRHSSLAFLHPSMMCWGWIFWETNFSASLKSSPAKTATLVVPSPTSSSWVFEMSKKRSWIKFSHFQICCYCLPPLPPSKYTTDISYSFYALLTNEDLGSRVINMDGPQDGSTVIGDNDLLIMGTSWSRLQDFILF